MFRLERPKGRPAPVLVEIPHAGTAIPAEVLDVLAVDPREAWRDADTYVDELYRGVTAHGATVLAAELSRYVVDLNRDEWDADERAVAMALPGAREHITRGVIWRETSTGTSLLRRPLTRDEFETRLERYYRPYHRALAQEIERLRSRFGQVVLVAAHSMPSTGTVGGVPVRRADVVPGTRGKTTAARVLIDAVETHFRTAGLSVRHDDPYRGGATTVRWGRPREGIHVIQVELNRALYMDEATGQPRAGGFRWLASLCDGLVAGLTEMAMRVM